MGGNDKLTTSRETWTGRGLEAFSACFQTGQFDPVLTFYDISAPGLHLPGTGKTPGVAQRRQPAVGKVTPGRRFAIRNGADIISL
jgi:hypothetical protein